MLRANREVPREVSRDVQDLIRNLQQIDPSRLAHATPEKLDEIIGSLLGSTEQIELELRRFTQDKQDGSIRSGVSQPAPPGYADAVAEYFRRLAKQK